MKQGTARPQRTTYGKIIDIRIGEDGLPEVKVELSNGEVVGGYEQGKPDLTPRLNVLQANYKIFKFSENSPASVQAKDDAVYLMGSKVNRFVSTRDFGNFVSGPTTFIEHPQNIRIGGVYRFNGQLTSTVPSTIMTPIPTLVLDIPGEATLRTLKNILTDFKQMIGL